MKTVVLLNVSGPVDVRNWIADAVLCIFIPGYMGGKAVADMLLGNAAPAGRLPVTFSVRYEDTPSYPNFPGEHNDVYYGEGIFVGYRNYEKRKISVQYPFGYGLSYSKFKQESELDGLEFDLRNQKELQLVLKAEELACFDPKMEKWVIPTGEYQLYLGTSSQEIFAEIPMRVIGENPYTYGSDTLFSVILADPKATEVLERYLPGLLENDGVSILGDRTLRDAMSMIVIGYMPNAVEAEKMLQKMYQDIAEIQ